MNNKWKMNSLKKNSKKLRVNLFKSKMELR